MSVERSQPPLAVEWVGRAEPPLDAIRLEVRGFPQSQGSMTFYGKGRVAHGRPAHARELAAWRSGVGLAAREAMAGRPLLAGPCGVEVVFRLERPLTHHRGRRRSHPVRADVPHLNSSKPDLDKLVRALLDSLTAICWGDDAQVAHVVADKLYAQPGEPGASVAVWALVEASTEPERETVTLTLDAGEEAR